MSPYWSSLLLAVALSADSLGVGIAYGLRSIRIPLGSLAVIALCTGVLMGLPMALGGILHDTVTPDRAPILGGLILAAVGGWQLNQGLRRRRNHLERSTPEGPLLHLRIPLLGLVVHILRDPASADANRSGTIDGRESLLLGAALGLDALGAGFGASMAGFPFWVVPAAAVASMAFVFIGSRAARRAAAAGLGERAGLVPGLLLLLLGAWKLAGR